MPLKTIRVLLAPSVGFRNSDHFNALPDYEIEPKAETLTLAEFQNRFNAQYTMSENNFVRFVWGDDV